LLAFSSKSLNDFISGCWSILLLGGQKMARVSNKKAALNWAAMK
jgi:hypothetical protein